MWQEILKTAIVGTERNALGLSARGDALGDVLAKLDANARETSLLSAAAAVALYERAGQLPARDAQPLPAAAEADDTPCCNARAAQHLSLMLGGEYKEVLSEWLAAIAAAGKRVPEEALPALLALGKTNEALQEAIGKVIGKRGVWLAQQNPDWDYVVASMDESHWHTGTRNTRLVLLQQLRAADPTRARELVAATWNEEKPEDRAAFIATFITGLSLADEPFLEAALDDRRKEVRKAAAELLARLLESALVKRMIARAEPLISVTKNKIEIALPEIYDKSMQRDGIEQKPSILFSIGEKAWWLCQIVGAIPPSLWGGKFAVSPQSLLNMIPKDWLETFLIGLATATEHFQDESWAEVLFDYAQRHKNIFQHRFGESLPTPSKERLLTKLMESAFTFPVGTLRANLLLGIQGIWSPEISQLVLQSLAYQVARQGKPEGQIDEYFLLLAIPKLHPSTFQAAIHLLSEGASSVNFRQRDATDRPLSLLQFRADMLKEITQ